MAGEKIKWKDEIARFAASKRKTRRIECRNYGHASTARFRVVHWYGWPKARQEGVYVILEK